MKKRLALLPILLFLFAFTCDNEELNEDIQVIEPVVTDPGTEDPGTEEPGTEDPATLTGDWDLVSFSFDISTSTDFSGQVLEVSFIGETTEANYIITLTEDTFSGAGSYTYLASGTANGTEIPPTEYTLNDVTSDGNYSTDGNTMTTSGSFFEFDFGGQVETGSFDGPQTAEYELSEDGDTITFSQNETTVQTENGVETTITNISTSVFQRIE